MIDRARIEKRFPNLLWEASGDSFVVPAADAVEVARWLRDDEELRLDYASNVTGVDYLTFPKPKGAEAAPESPAPCFEVVYHLYSMARKHGPLVLKQRTEGRDHPRVASLTPIYRGAEFQEREIFDLFGIEFTGHPDLRRLLMWEGFTAHPMRKDYVEPNDYEYEPTAHAEVLARAREAGKPAGN